VPTVALGGLVLAVLAVSAAISPWVSALLDHRFTFARLFDRVFEVALVVVLLLAWRRLDLGGPAAIGLLREGWGRQVARGLAIGLAGMAVGLLVAWAAGGLVPQLRYDPAKTVRKALLGLGAAAAIGLGEEVLFRGVLLRRLGIDLGRVAGLVGTTAIYGAVHAIRASGGDEAPGPWAGFERVAALFEPLGSGRALPAVAGLVGFGFVLAAARLRTGTLWMAVGVHAAWVAAFRVGRLFFSLKPTPVWAMGPGWPPVVGGLAGWTAVVVTGLLVLAATRRRGS
jgi:membrane protease YdiL (CAAX protease family)